MTGQDLIASALRLIGVLASGETASAAEAADGLVILNQMIDSWNAERLSVFHILPNGRSTDTNTFALVPSQQDYTMGTGGNFNVARPAKIERASIEYLANPAQPLELPLEILDYAGWQAIPLKVTTSNIPRYVYIDNAFPLRNLRFWPVPSEVHNAILYYWNALTQFTALITDLTFPPGYLKALRYNLAVDLAPEYGRSVPIEVAVQATQSKAKIKSMNLPRPIMVVDDALREGGAAGQYDWRTDLPAGRRY